MPAPLRDLYADLLRDTRGLKREHALERERWYSALTWDRKEETLFELEMLLKSLVCFFNPRNHPGALRALVPLAHDFREEMRMANGGVQRTVVLCRAMLGERDRAFDFHRYLETVVRRDDIRTRIAGESLAQPTPEASLYLLRNAFATFAEISESLLKLSRIPYRLFAAVGQLLLREVGRNLYFNPIIRLEFRAEFDRLKSPDLLELLAGVRSETGHKVVALTFLAIFRLLRYLRLVRPLLRDGESLRSSYVLFALYRSDARSLSAFMRFDARRVLAEGFEREFSRLKAREVGTAYEALRTEFAQLRRLRELLESLGSQVRLEARRVFGQILPAVDALPVEGVLRSAVEGALANLQTQLQHAAVAVAREFRPDIDGDRLFDDFISRQAQSERLRRDVWVFAAILQRFIERARDAGTDADRWQGFTSFQFVRDYIGYFRNMGYQLLRFTEFEAFDRFLGIMESLRDSDILDPFRLQAALRESTAFHAFLEETFRRIGQREELRGMPFDEPDALRTLREYLEAQATMTGTPSIV